MKRIHGRLVGGQRVSFSELFEPGMHKSAMVGVFLAVLELTRYHHVEAEQKDLHSEIWMAPAEGFKDEIEVHTVDDYSPHAKNLKPGDPSSLIQ
jgi:segregation and condensation protein A